MVSAAVGTGPPEMLWLQDLWPLAAATHRRRRSALQIQVCEDFLNHRLHEHRGDDLRFAAAVGAVRRLKKKFCPTALRRETASPPFVCDR